MKKLIIALALLMSCSGMLPICAANWYWVAEDVSGGQWYIDNSSVVKEYGEIAKVWVRVDMENGHSKLALWEINRNRTATMLQYIIYNEKHEAVDSYVWQSWEYEAVAIPPNTLIEAVYNLIW